MDKALLLLLVKVTIFTLMLTLGINLSLERLGSFWRQPSLLFRALLAVIVLTPLVVFILLKLLNLPPEVATGFALLAASPGAPLTTKRAYMAGAKIHDTVALQFTLALLAVVVTPLTLNLFHASFELLSEKISVLEVSRQIASVQLLPLGLGFLLQKLSSKLVNLMDKPLNIIANLLFLILVVVAILPAFLLIVQMNLFSFITIAIIVLAALAIGHYLGGSDIEKRAALAIACVARNFGLALFIATLNDIQKLVLPSLLAYLLLGAVLAFPYSLWSKRQIQLKLNS